MKGAAIRQVSAYRSIKRLIAFLVGSDGGCPETLHKPPDTLHIRAGRSPVMQPQSRPYPKPSPDLGFDNGCSLYIRTIIGQPGPRLRPSG